jgi:autonomous glycyl radical cofactor GrcA
LTMTTKEIKERTSLREILHDRSYETDEILEIRDLGGILEAKITVSPNRVESGEKVSVNLSIKNTSERPVSLSFIAHEGPMLDLKVTGPDSEDSVYPPPKPSMIARSGPPYSVGVMLMPGGEIFHESKWEAVRYDWSPDAMGPVPIPLRGYESAVRTVGPLAPGRYKIQIYAMFNYAGYGIEDPAGWLEVIG